MQQPLNEKGIFDVSGKELGQFAFRMMSFCVGFYFFLDYIIDCKVKTGHGMISLVLGLIITSILIAVTK